MDSSLWTVLGAAVAVVAVYLLVMRYLLHRSRQADKQVDFSKIKKWEDEEDTWR